MCVPLTTAVHLEATSDLSSASFLVAFYRFIGRRGCPRTGYQEISWQFIPAGSPHMGGLWEGAVKSFKKHFHRHVQFFKYIFEELPTVLVRIEACLNSCPLCP